MFSNGYVLLRSNWGNANGTSEVLVRQFHPERVCAVIPTFLHHFLPNFMEKWILDQKELRDYTGKWTSML
jgi:hypothetical protein